jgi:hypothetical protein
MEDASLYATVVVAAITGLLPIVSSYVRNLLKAIFRKPRESSVILTVNDKRPGKRGKVTGIFNFSPSTDPAERERRIESLLASLAAEPTDSSGSAGSGADAERSPKRRGAVNE